MSLSLMRSATENKEVTHERKFRTHEIPTRKNLGPTKYPGESFLGPRNTHEQKFWPHEIPTSRNFGLTKYPRRHDGAMALNPRDP